MNGAHTLTREHCPEAVVDQKMEHKRMKTSTSELIGVLLTWLNCSMGMASIAHTSCQEDR